MKKKTLFFVIVIGIIGIGLYTIQGTNKKTVGYLEKIKAERDEKNEFFKISEESPLTAEQKMKFASLNYFPVAEKYKVHAEMHENSSNQIVNIQNTDGGERAYFVYGNAHFHLDGKELDITVYKSVDSSEDYFFIPFYDKTSNELTYGGGRYVEPTFLNGGILEIDFNLAYNPYCVYNFRFVCPIPPEENRLDVSILSGEKMPDFVD